MKICTYYATIVDEGEVVGGCNKLKSVVYCDGNPADCADPETDNFITG